jgi:RNA polymerase sigma factor (sigma-70 family)
MTATTLRGVLDNLGLAALDDRRLLERFLADRDEAAFEALVRRHGPLVLGVCRRVLRHAHDAEDAFQATFLVLACKAGSIARRDALPAWLYGVAYRVASRARAAAERRRSREAELGDPAAPAAPPPDGPGADLDAEISRLPDAYRLPLLLCELQGRSRRDASRALGLPEGTLSSRLARGRDLLRRRLTRRGVALGAGALSAGLTQAALPPGLPAATARSALSFVGCGGAVPARAAELARAALRPLLPGALAGGLAVVLTLGLFGAYRAGLAPTPAEAPAAVAALTPPTQAPPVEAAPPEQADDAPEDMAVEPPTPHDEPPEAAEPPPPPPRAPPCRKRLKGRGLRLEGGTAPDKGRP